MLTYKLPGSFFQKMDKAKHFEQWKNCALREGYWSRGPEHLENCEVKTAVIQEDHPMLPIL